MDVSSITTTYPDLPLVSSNRQVRARLDPGNRRHGQVGISLRAEVGQMFDFRSPSVPNIDRIAQGHCHVVHARPIDGVEVEVVDQGGSVQDTVGLRGDEPSGGLLNARRQGALRVNDLETNDTRSEKRKTEYA